MGLKEDQLYFLKANIFINISDQTYSEYNFIQCSWRALSKRGQFLQDEKIRKSKETTKDNKRLTKGAEKRNKNFKIPFD